MTEQEFLEEGEAIRRMALEHAMQRTLMLGRFDEIAPYPLTPRWFSFLKHLTKAMWRHVCGRFFVWRDAPDDIVEMIALAYTLWPEEHTDEDVKLLYAQAVDEWRLRERRKEST